MCGDKVDNAHEERHTLQMQWLRLNCFTLQTHCADVAEKEQNYSPGSLFHSNLKSQKKHFSLSIVCRVCVCVVHESEDI